MLGWPCRTGCAHGVDAEMKRGLRVIVDVLLIMVVARPALFIIDAWLTFHRLAQRVRRGRHA